MWAGVPRTLYLRGGRLRGGEGLVPGTDSFRGWHLSGVRRLRREGKEPGVLHCPLPASAPPSRRGAARSPWGPAPAPLPPCRLWPRLPQHRTASPSRPAAPPGQLTDVFGSDGHRPSQLGDELLGVQADLDDVIQQREQRGQRKRRHEQGDEAELDDCEESGGLSTHRAPPPTGARRPEPPSRTRQVWWAPSPPCVPCTRVG